MFDIKEELKKLPSKPGVYLMKDEGGTVIYVGKAVVLKNRVRQYFQKGNRKSPKIEKMVENIKSFEYIITDSEMEALILECNLIKEYSPRYNTMLTDDKSYPYIKITMNEPFPRIFSTRNMKRDGSKYYGPYTTAKAVKDIIELIRKIYKIRSCRSKLLSSGNNLRTCLYYHMDMCDAPCVDKITPEKYKENVKKSIKLLEGNYDEVIKELTDKMTFYSERMDYERALVYRDLISELKLIAEKQGINSVSTKDRDVIAIARDLDGAVAQVFFVRDGKLIGREHYYLKNVEDAPLSELYSSFVKQFYMGIPFIPSEISLREKIEDSDLLSDWLSKVAGRKIVISKNDDKLIELAYKNANLVLSIDKQRLQNEELRTKGAVKSLSNILNINNLRRIEAYDISHISGSFAVGAMVVYDNGVPKKSDYRKFRIEGNVSGDDYGSLREVLKRRLLRSIESMGYLYESYGEKSNFPILPDLILMDGGKGQVNIAISVLEELGLHIPVCGMVKDDKHRTRGLYYNNVEILNDINDECLRLITNIQDEVHRFAITYHKKLRSNEQVHSVLDDIKGIGSVRRKALMKEFGSIEAISNASLEDLANVDSMDKNSANEVYNYFRSEGSYSIIEE